MPAVLHLPPGRIPLGYNPAGSSSSITTTAQLCNVPKPLLHGRNTSCKYTSIWCAGSGDRASYPDPAGVKASQQQQPLCSLQQTNSVGWTRLGGGNEACSRSIGSLLCLQASSNCRLSVGQTCNKKLVVFSSSSMNYCFLFEGRFAHWFSLASGVLRPFVPSVVAGWF